jgi:hypothetical protein
MATNTKSNKTISVWVNAGESKIVLNRKDGAEWSRPLFFNAPNGVREKIAIWLGKVLTDENGKPVLKLNKTTGQMEKQVDFTKKATNNCEWEMDLKMVKTEAIKSGANAGKLADSITITDENLSGWLKQLVFTKRGSIRANVATTLSEFEPTIIGDDDEDSDDFEDF